MYSRSQVTIPPYILTNHIPTNSGVSCMLAPPDLGSLESVVQSEAREPPSWVKTARDGEGEEESTEPIRATTEEACPECNHPQL